MNGRRFDAPLRAAGVAAAAVLGIAGASMAGGRAISVRESSGAGQERRSSCLCGLATASGGLTRAPRPSSPPHDKPRAKAQEYGAGVEIGTVHDPVPTSFPYELDFIVGMAVRSGTVAGQRVKQKYGDVHVALIGADELVRAADEREVVLSNVMHRCVAQ